MSIRLVLADDHPLILNGLVNLFQLEQDFEVLESCADGVEAMRAISRHQPDVALLDIRMPGMTGLEIARKVREQKLPTRLVLLTAGLDDEQIVEATHLNVDGIVLKEMAPELLVQCIRKVHQGEQWVERRSMQHALEMMLRREAGTREMAALLTQREIELVRAMAHGQRNREIADKLCISEGTVKAHLHNIYDKLKLDGRMALLRYALDKGLV